MSKRRSSFSPVQVLKALPPCGEAPVFDPLSDISTETVLMTPELAAEILNRAKYERQRAIRKDHVQFLADEMLAGRFWSRVAQNDGLREGDPERTLVEYLLNHTLTTGRESYRSRAVATCWNAAFDGRPLKLVKVPDHTAPIRIAGTPYDGKAHYRLGEFA